jgi:formylglycine-generating enzyme required for sulfatase activity
VDENALGQYARIFHNSYDGLEQRSFPVGSLKPNDLGLFDMHGNVSEWCQDVFSGQGLPPNVIRPPVQGDGNELFDSVNRMMRGGSFLHRPQSVRTSTLLWALPTYGSSGVGFRPVRVVP